MTGELVPYSALLEALLNPQQLQTAHLPNSEMLCELGLTPNPTLHPHSQVSLLFPQVPQQDDITRNFCLPLLPPLPLFNQRFEYRVRMLTIITGYSRLRSDAHHLCTISYHVCSSIHCNKTSALTFNSFLL